MIGGTGRLLNTHLLFDCCDPTGDGGSPYPLIFFLAKEIQNNELTSLVTQHGTDLCYFLLFDGVLEKHAGLVKPPRFGTH